MSNEYKDHIADLRATFNEKMWEIEFLYDGWLKTFVPQMMDELFDALGSYVEDFTVLQIKEKFARMRLYWGWADRDYTDAETEELNELYKIIEHIIAKYEDISSQTCIECGNKATHFSTEWICPYCDSCRDKSKGVSVVIQDQEE